jgi:hypothetical protein
MHALYYVSLVLGGIAVLVLVLYVLSYFIEGISHLTAVLLRAAIPLALLAGAAYLIHRIASGGFS